MGGIKNVVFIIVVSEADTDFPQIPSVLALRVYHPCYFLQVVILKAYKKE